MGQAAIRRRSGGWRLAARESAAVGARWSSGTSCAALLLTIRRQRRDWNCQFRPRPTLSGQISFRPMPLGAVANTNARVLFYDAGNGNWAGQGVDTGGKLLASNRAVFRQCL